MPVNTFTCVDAKRHYILAICDQDCSGHGNCTEPDACECYIGYGGDICQYGKLCMNECMYVNMYVHVYTYFYILHIRYL